MNSNLFARLGGLALCLLLVFYQIVYFNDQLLLMAGYNVLRHPPFVVHLDFKGAVPRTDYILQLVTWLGQRKVSGILVEYETMFPFDGKLADLSTKHHMSHEDIADMLLTADRTGMEVIPYVNTFTDLQYVVDNADAFDDLVKSFGGQTRNSWNTCHKHKLPERLVTEIVDQVLSLHPNSRHIYIGSSKLAELNTDTECLIMEKENRIGELYYRHVQYISQHIHHNWPGVTVLAAADALADLSEVQLKAISEYMQPVVVETDVVRSNDTESLITIGVDYFSKVWGASSYKGMRLPSANYVHLKDTLKNNGRWRELIGGVRRSDFGGLFLMGRSRQGYRAPLCELIPVALPSLALAMNVVLNNFTLEVGHRTAVGLGFNGFVYERPFIEAGRLKFPGSTVFKAVSELEVTMNDNKYRTMINIDVDFLQRLESSLRSVYPRHVVKEWMKLKVTAWTDKDVHEKLRPYGGGDVLSTVPPTAEPVRLDKRGAVWLGSDEVHY
eukprot:scpid39836/ scgid1075/ Hexosaminidase D; Beta-N-acetylhexosaminidase; Beta-hexosaminidase D; Hexosaminidase domain-containing protein; N-acetyl-beta-galactosaminidase